SHGHIKDYGRWFVTSKFVLMRWVLRASITSPLLRFLAGRPDLRPEVPERQSRLYWHLLKAITIRCGCGQTYSRTSTPFLRFRAGHSYRLRAITAILRYRHNL